MALVRVLSPQSESEIAVVTSLLEAHDIPVFVHGRHLGSLLPGLQIGSYNTQSIMVPEECESDALELLSEFRRNDSSATSAPLRGRDRLRVVLEGILFGWLVPGRRKDRKAGSREDHDA
jgi:putative signal transducing protein